MLLQAQQRDAPLCLAQGRASRLAFPAAFDLVYCVNAIHHFQEPRTFVEEARRLLRPNGALAVIGMDPRAHRDRWYIYDYFENTYEIDLARMPSWGAVTDWMVAAGLTRLEWRLVEHIVDCKVGPAVLDDPFLKKEAVSQLALLTNEAYEAGLRRIESALAAAKAAGETLSFPTDLLLGMMVGWVGG
jgi:SAM-dependent methyltransferase